ncbi:helix-turn-helix domain-containing protein [Actinokineospora sp. HUAS TT18]|uniref:helix-turn-helix domain-containing protein n=1 Tax=Actinokineospora sp. HUAS TT18 TaxID=3447451 RepID=UPI003F51EE3D
MDRGVGDRAAALGSELKRARLRLGLTLVEAAERMSTRGVLANRTQLSRFEHGEREPKIGLFVDICEAYGCDPTEVLLAALWLAGGPQYRRRRDGSIVHSSRS